MDCLQHGLQFHGRMAVTSRRIMTPTMTHPSTRNTFHRNDSGSCTRSSTMTLCPARIAPRLATGPAPPKSACLNQPAALNLWPVIVPSPSVRHYEAPYSGAAKAITALTVTLSSSMGSEEEVDTDGHGCAQNENASRCNYQALPRHVDWLILFAAAVTICRTVPRGRGPATGTRDRRRRRPTPPGAPRSSWGLPCAVAPSTSGFAGPDGTGTA